mgnify:CR=1 FL=1
MKTITVAGISIVENKKKNFTYEQLFKRAKESKDWLRVKDADKKIDAELREHGFKPAKKSANQDKAAKSSKD